MNFLKITSFTSPLPELTGNLTVQIMKHGNPEPEELNDYELGWRLLWDKFQLNSNLYYMDYQNQLVLDRGTK